VSRLIAVIALEWRPSEEWWWRSLHEAYANELRGVFEDWWLRGAP